MPSPLSLGYIYCTRCMCIFGHSPGEGAADLLKGTATAGCCRSSLCFGDIVNRVGILDAVSRPMNSKSICPCRAFIRFIRWVAYKLQQWRTLKVKSDPGTRKIPNVKFLFEPFPMSSVSKLAKPTLSIRVYIDLCA